MKSKILLLLALFVLSAVPSFAAGGGSASVPAYTDLKGGGEQYAKFPIPLEKYEKVEGGVMETIKEGTTVYLRDGAK
jgi:hypothetical protein